MTAAGARAAFVVAAIVAGLIVPASGGPSAYAAAGTLSGTVTEAGSATPLDGVRIRAFCWEVAGSNAGDVCGETESSTGGTYSLSLAAGSYKIAFDDYPSHRVQFYGGGEDLGDADSVEVQVPSGGSTTGVDATLTALQVIDGLVSGGGGPVGGINVTAHELSGTPTPTWQQVDSTVTEPDGTYALHVPDGTYRVGFADAHGPYRAEFYDDASSLEQADDVVVDGDPVGGVDADLGLNHPITGTVTVDGVNMPGVAVTAYQEVPTGPGTSDWQAMKVVTSGPEGRYALYLPDGVYRVEFQTWQARYGPVYYDQVAVIDFADDVVVAGAEVPDINGAIGEDLPAGGPAITGTATVFGSSSPARGVLVTAWRRNEITSDWVRVKDAVTSFDGSYELFVPEGSYRVGFADEAGFYEPVFFDGAATIDEATDVVQTTDGASGIDVVLAERNSISGTVTADDQPGAPPGEPPGTIATAWRFDVASSSWQDVNRTFAGPDGTYRLYVSDGTYRVGFRNDLIPALPPEYYDDAASVEEGDDIVVAGADVVGIDAHLGTGTPDPGDPWPPAETMSPHFSDGSAPDVALDPRGDALAVWHQWTGRHQQVLASTRTAGGEWRPAVVLSPPGVDAWDPQVAVGDRGLFVVVWRSWTRTGYRIESIARSGDSWRRPAPVSPRSEDAWDPQVAVGPRGDAVVVWRRSTSEGHQVRSRARAPDGSWSTPVSLSRGGDAWAPQVAVDPNGTTIAVWSRAAAARYRIQAATRAAFGGRWTEPVSLSTAGADAWDPQVVAGAKGSATVVWRRWDGDHERIQAATRSTPAAGSGWRGQRDELGSAWSTLADRRATWSGPVTLSAAGADAYDQEVAIGPDGTVTAVWSRGNGSIARVQAATLARGQAWSSPRNLSEHGEDARSPHVATGRDGMPTVAWRHVDGSGERIRVATRDPDGSWPVPTDLTGPGDRAYGPEVATGSGGSVAVLWEWRDADVDVVRGTVLDATSPVGGGRHD